MDGILIVDKPEGMTSHDVVDFIRRRFRIKKAGHTGTLDPAVTGVLVIMLGKATKLSSELTGADKEYEATISLGRKTDTADRGGKILFEGDYRAVTEKDIYDVFRVFEGKIEQIPPMVSALKHKGRRLYELARAGHNIPLGPRIVYIYRLKVGAIRIPDIDFSVFCSKGTYIRKLCDDIGDRLGCGAHLSRLRRIRAGRFTLENSVLIDRLKNFSIDELERHILKV